MSDPLSLPNDGACAAPRRGRPKIDRDKRRQRILDAASAQFFERGFADTTIEGVAAAAGVTKRTVYEDFGDKEVLFQVVCNENASSAANMALPELGPDTDLREALEGLAHTLLNHALAPDRIAIARLITSESMRFPALARKVLEAGSASIGQVIFTVFDFIEQSNLARVPNRPLAAQMFYDITVGNVAFRETVGLGGATVDDQELARRLDTFIRGYLGMDKP